MRFANINIRDQNLFIFTNMLGGVMSKEVALEIIEEMKARVDKYLANTDKILNRKRKK